MAFFCLFLIKYLRLSGSEQTELANRPGKLEKKVVVADFFGSFVQPNK